MSRAESTSDIRSTRLSSSWIVSAANWLTPRRIRAQAMVLAICLWGAFAVDFATPGLFDRAGNVKFQDFLPFYIAARLIRDGRSGQLFDQRVATAEMQATLGQPTRVRLATVYSPQVGLMFVPLARFSFPMAARIWTAVSLLIYFVCIYGLWRSCPALRPYSGIVGLAALAYPPLFHSFVRGQVSSLVLLCFSAAFFALDRRRDWLAGVALGFLIFKPQFLVAIPLVLLLSHAWEALVGLVLSAAAELAVTWFCFGTSVMRAYFDMLLHPSRWIAISELSLAPVQMHSLRSFWTLLLPWPQAAFVLYVLCSLVVVWWAARICKSSTTVALRFCALTLAALLVNPHLFIYDLLAFAPALLLLADWTLAHAQPDSAPAFRLPLYLAYLLPLFGPWSQWTRLQLSVPASAALLWLMSPPFVLSMSNTSPGHKVASNESADV